MGPSVKFVLAIIDKISQKNGVDFFLAKLDTKGEGGRAEHSLERLTIRIRLSMQTCLCIPAATTVYIPMLQPMS